MDYLNTICKDEINYGSSRTNLFSEINKINPLSSFYIYISYKKQFLF